MKLESMVIVYEGRLLAARFVVPTVVVEDGFSRADFKVHDCVRLDGGPATILAGFTSIVEPLSTYSRVRFFPL